MYYNMYKGKNLRRVKITNKDIGLMGIGVATFMAVYLAFISGEYMSMSTYMINNVCIFSMLHVLYMKVLVYKFILY